MGGYNTCIYLGMMLSSAALGGVIDQLGYPVTFLPHCPAASPHHRLFLLYDQRLLPRTPGGIRQKRP